MRILGIGDYGDLGDLYAQLIRGGHQVRMAIADPAYQDVFRGMVSHTHDWRVDLPWIRAAGDDGLIIVETAHQGALQDDLRRDGFRVIGSCSLGDRLEGDRTFAQETLQRYGLRTAQMRRFTDAASAIAYIRDRPRRYVCKHNGHRHPSTSNQVGDLLDGADIIAVLQHAAKNESDLDVVLMDFIEGVETGVGAYFDGRRFVGPVCLDWEHKRFFPGDLGELTGEMGTVVTYRGGERLFSETLGRLTSLLAEHQYQGYINLNTIINDDGVWPLEFTCRFGYPGFAILDTLHTAPGWEGLLRAMCGTDVDVVTHPGYAVGVVITVPPFPYVLTSPPSRGLPITFRGGLSPEDMTNVHYGEVDFSQGVPVVGGASGYVLVATGRGADVSSARQATYRLIDHIVVPNARYRTDIGMRFIERDAQRLRGLGYLPDQPTTPSIVR